jgi:hypothetical protein
MHGATLTTTYRSWHDNEAGKTVDNLFKQIECAYLVKDTKHQVGEQLLSILEKTFTDLPDTPFETIYLDRFFAHVKEIEQWDPELYQPRKGAVYNPDADRHQSTYQDFRLSILPSGGNSDEPQSEFIFDAFQLLDLDDRSLNAKYEPLFEYVSLADLIEYATGEYSASGERKTAVLSIEGDYVTIPLSRINEIQAHCEKINHKHSDVIIPQLKELRKEWNLD